jgi:6-pyruvoyltetrahydropterin/6-carboxytetrahydropterin synthase
MVAPATAVSKKAGLRGQLVAPLTRGDGSQEAEVVFEQTRSVMKAGYYTLTIKDHFDAAHALVGYPGECRQLHGHTWDIEVSVSGSELDEVGIVYDFKDLKGNLATILADYDHVYLNEVPPFDHINATAEHLARVIYERLEAMLPAHIALEEVGVWESPIAKLTYRRA